MSGTKLGGLKAAKTNKERHGKGFYAEIGAKGGHAGRTGGFYGNPELARRAGSIGGTISKRGPARKAVCGRGHSMENAYIWSGKRYCRECGKIRNARYAARTEKKKFTWDELKDKIFS